MKIVLAFVIVLSGSAMLADAQSLSSPLQPVPLFTEVNAGRAGVARQRTLREGELRSREVEVQLTPLGGFYGAGTPQPRLSLTLFPGESHIAVLDRLETTFEGRSWIGHLEGVDLSSVIITVTRGVVAGSVVWTGGHEFAIAADTNGAYVVTELKSSLPSVDDAVEALPARSDIVRGQPSAANTDDPSVVDILAIYTPEVRAEVGSEAGVAAGLDQLVSRLNVALSNSGVSGHVRIVGTLQIPFSLMATCGQTLNSLANTTDGNLDEVGALRDAYGADLVHVFIFPKREDCAGVAYYANRPELAAFGFAHSLMDRNSGAAHITFQHEVGHNLGAHHDWYVDDTRTSAKGYSNCAAGWRDLMAYGDECAAHHLGSSALPNFSNPNVRYNGQPTGIPRGTGLGCRAGNINNPPCDADNATEIANSFGTVANHRASRFVAPNFPPRNESFDFRAQLEGKYRDTLRRPVAGSYADPEGAVVWTVEYLRYRLAQCGHEVAVDKVRRQVRGEGLPEPCGSAVTAVFPPRNETYAFRLALEDMYRVDLRRQASDTRVDPEGDVVWIQEYLRYRLGGCNHSDAVARSMLQVDGQAPPPLCR